MDATCSGYSIGLVAKAGRYGGTFAHKDIAFEFVSWLSPEFKLYLIVTTYPPMLAVWIEIKIVLAIADKLSYLACEKSI